MLKCDVAKQQKQKWSLVVNTFFFLRNCMCWYTLHKCNKFSGHKIHWTVKMIQSSWEKPIKCSNRYFIKTTILILCCNEMRPKLCILLACFVKKKMGLHTRKTHSTIWWWSYSYGENKVPSFSSLLLFIRILKKSKSPHIAFTQYHDLLIILTYSCHKSFNHIIIWTICILSVPNLLRA